LKLLLDMIFFTLVLLHRLQTISLLTDAEVTKVSNTAWQSPH
jgi:hypothetical protein